MKNKITLGLFTLVLAAIISSCSTSSDVASNRKIQKRKYNKGFFVSNNNVAFNKEKNNDKTTVESQSDISEVKAKIGSNEKTINSNATKIVENTVVDIPSNEIENSSIVVNEENVIASTDFLIGENTDVKTIELKNKKESKKVKTSGTKNNSNSSNSGVMLVVLVILAIIIPPLAVFIFEGVTTRFWIDLILALLAFGGWFLIGGLAGLAGLIAIIYALLIVLEVI